MYGVGHVNRNVNIDWAYRELILLRIWYVRTLEAQQVTQVVLQGSLHALVEPRVVWLIPVPVLRRDRRDGINKNHGIKWLVWPPRFQEGMVVVEAKLWIARGIFFLPTESVRKKSEAPDCLLHSLFHVPLLVAYSQSAFILSLSTSSYTLVSALPSLFYKWEVSSQTSRKEATNYWWVAWMCSISG